MQKKQNSPPTHVKAFRKIGKMGGILIVILVNPKGNESWIFIGRTNAEAEPQILWPPEAKSWLTGKDPDAGKDWRQEEKGTTENEIIGWHHHSKNMSLRNSQEIVKDRVSWGLQSMESQRVGHDLVTGQQQIIIIIINIIIILMHQCFALRNNYY